MDEQQLQQQIIALVQAAMSGDEQATLQILQIMQAAQLGNKQAVQIAQMIQLVAQQLQLQLTLNQAVMAKFGAKLNYIRRLKGLCPEGYEMLYFKSGGKVCKQCVKKRLRLQSGGVPTKAVDAFKCGRKMKKKACGGSVEKDACGSKMKKAVKKNK